MNRPRRKEGWKERRKGVGRRGRGKEGRRKGKKLDGTQGSHVDVSK